MAITVLTSSISELGVNMAAYEVASEAPPSVQDEKAWETYKARGWQPWPTCKIKMGLQDIYR